MAILRNVYYPPVDVTDIGVLAKPGSDGRQLHIPPMLLRRALRQLLLQLRGLVCQARQPMVREQPTCFFL